MRQIRITRVGGPKSSRFAKRKTRLRAQAQCAIRVCALGINFADTMAHRALPRRAELPFVPGYEVAAHRRGG